MIHYGVVIPARNSEAHIKYSVTSIKDQTLKPKLIVVVDDSSSDRTGDIASKLGARVVRIRRKSRVSAVATPYLAYVINCGLRLLERENLDYVMISGADCIYPRNYVKLLIKRMIRERVVLASGVIAGEYTSYLSVRGSGRIINAKWFRTLGFKYPTNYGYETWLIFKALTQGLKVKVYRDLKFVSIRKTSFNRKKAYLYGKAMKALGYLPQYVLARVFLTALLQGHQEAKHMLLGYIKYGGNGYNSIHRYAKIIQLRALVRKLFSKH